MTGTCLRQADPEQGLGNPGSYAAVGAVDKAGVTARLIDHLDIHSLLLAKRSGPTAYLTRSQNPATNALIALMERCGWRFEAATSPYETRKEPGSYPAISKEILMSAIAFMQPEVEAHLDKAGYPPGLERSRIARFVVLGQFKAMKRAIEVIQAGQDMCAQICLQRNVAAMAAVQATGACCRLYRAPLRLRMVARPGYFEHETDRWPGETFSADLIRLPGMTALVLWAMFRGLFGKSGGPPASDILALTGRCDPSDRLDDLYWSEALKELADARITLVHTTTAPPACRDYYRNRVEALLPLKDILSAKAGFGGSWRPIRAAQLKSLAKSMGAALFSGLPFWLSLRLATIAERTAFFEALIEVTGARIVWSMQEGHEPNTQALAIAASRRNAVAFGTSWSLKHNPCLASANNRNDVMFVWGARHRKIFQESGALVERYVLSGYPTADAALKAPQETQPKKRLCFYDNLAGHDTIAGPVEMADAYRTVLAAARARPGWTLIIKGKRDEYRRLDPTLASEINRLVTEGAIEFRDQPGDLTTALESDIVIGVGAATLALVAAQYGVRCVLFDPERISETTPFGAAGAVACAIDALQFETELKKAMDDFVPGDRLGGDIDTYADGTAGRRSAAVMADVLKALRKGGSRDEAIAAIEQE